MVLMMRDGMNVNRIQWFSRTSQHLAFENDNHFPQVEDRGHQHLMI